MTIFAALALAFVVTIVFAAFWRVLLFGLIAAVLATLALGIEQAMRLLQR